MPVEHLENTELYWHCGLLAKSGSLGGHANPIRSANWHTLPDDLERELRIWLAMPGFTLSYHAETLERSPREIAQFMGGFEEFEDDVLANWVSASREDCIALGWIRPAKGDLPLITKMQMRRDYMRGMAQKDIATDYQVWPSTVNKFCWGNLPDEVEELPQSLQNILRRDPYVTATVRLEARRLAEKAEAERQLDRKQACQLPPEMIEKISRALGVLPDRSSTA